MSNSLNAMIMKGGNMNPTGSFYQGRSDAQADEMNQLKLQRQRFENSPERLQMEMETLQEQLKGVKDKNEINALKHVNEQIGMAALYIKDLPEERRAAAWESAKQQLSNAGIETTDIPYSEDALNQALYRAQSVAEILSGRAEGAKFAETKRHNRATESINALNAGIKAPTTKTIVGPDFSETLVQWNPEKQTWDPAPMGGQQDAGAIDFNTALEMARREANDKDPLGPNVFRPGATKDAYGEGGREAWINQRAQEIMSGQDGNALNATSNDNYGTRVDGTPKGAGYFGELRRPDGKVSTELSIGVDFDGRETLIPAIVPTLNKSELDHLLNGGDVTDAIMKKAVEHARKRMQAGKSPFAEPGEQTIPPSGKNALNAAIASGGQQSQALPGRTSYKHPSGRVVTMDEIVKTAENRGITPEQVIKVLGLEAK